MFLKFTRILSYAFAATTHLAALLTRLLVGHGFFLSGRGKIANIDNVIEFFTSLSIPYPHYQAPFVARVEYYGGMLLILGLASRPTAFLLASTMVVALATADKADFLATLQPNAEALPVSISAFVYLLFLLWILGQGAGKLSCDAVINWLGQRRQAQGVSEPTN